MFGLKKKLPQSQKLVMTLPEAEVRAGVNKSMLKRKS